MEECRRRQIILPGVSVIERLCADALVAAERRIETRIAALLEGRMHARLDNLLSEHTDGHTSWFVWLRQFKVGNNSADAGRLLDGLNSCRRSICQPPRSAVFRPTGSRVCAVMASGISPMAFATSRAIAAGPSWPSVSWNGTPPSPMRWWRPMTGSPAGSGARQSGLRSCGPRRRRPTSAIPSARSGCLPGALMKAKAAGLPLEDAVEASCGWGSLETLAASAGRQAECAAADPLDHVARGWHRFRLYAPRMLNALEIDCASVARPLLEAAAVIRDGRNIPAGAMPFLRARSNWRRQMRQARADRERLWIVAVLFHLRDAFRSGDVWLRHSRRYADLKQALVPIEVARATGRLAVPFEAEDWIADRRRRTEDGLNRLARAAADGALPTGVIENGALRLERLESKVPEGAGDLVVDLYRSLPDVRITDLLLNVDDATRFTEAFAHLRTGTPCKDRIGLLNVLLAEGLNLGLRKMAEATSSHDYFQLSRLSRWHVEGDAINLALAMVIEAHARLPMAQLWGQGLTASSDGQFFPTTRQGEAMNLVNARYGHEPG